MKHSWRLFALGLFLILAGAVAAHLVQTNGGIAIKDVRFTGANGQTLSALLYIPPGVSSEAKAPAILAVHGYINSRETQSGFAIEFARRGYVVLALDQGGHGFSDPPAFANGFGGPAALAYLRSLDIVDTANIGLEGHSMGGWTVLAAAASMPDAYRSVVLEGSSTGAPFAQEGSPTWPRNLAVVFSRYDEFSELMWGVSRAQDVAASAKLQAVFGTDAPVEPGRVYGDLAAGSARVLWTPNTTHPGDHLSTEAIGYAIDWFARTLDGGKALPPADQIWPAKEAATLVALVGLVLLLAGSFDVLLKTRYFGRLAQVPATHAHGRRGWRWWLAFLASAAIPVATYYPFFSWGAWLEASPWLPQTITTQIAVWAVLNGIILFLLGFVLRGERVVMTSRWLPALLIALAVVGIGYLAVLAADFFLKVDFRFWIVALKPMTAIQARIALVYLVPFAIFFLLAHRALHAGLTVAGDGRAAQYWSNIGALALGFLGLLVLQYATLLVAGHLLTPSEPLNTIVAMQFLPLMVVVGFLATYTYRRTASYVPGALINALFVTWYIIAGQATQYPLG